MKLAYLVLAHKNPAQLARLLQRLNADNVYFYIHIDKRSPLHLFQQQIPADLKAKVFFVDRLQGAWGTFGIVQATLNGLQMIYEDRERSIDCVVLVSGQDYPLKSALELYDFFKTHKDRSHLFYFKLPSEAKLGKGGGMDRVERYYFHFLGKQRVYPSTDGSRLDILYRAFFSLPRVYPMGLDPYCGSQWWSMSRDAIEYVLEFDRKNPKFKQFQQTTLLPDESFFQTILMNSPMAETVVCADLRYADWTKPNVHLPATLTSEDFDTVMNSKALIARKFDTEADVSVMDRIDAFIHSSIGKT